MVKINKNYLIKTNRTFTKWRKWSWLFTILVAFGGLYEPKLGLLVIPVIVGLIGTSFFTGRFWCGNICAHGSLYDRVLLKYSLNQKIPKLFRSKILMVLFFLWFGGRITLKMVKVFTTFSGLVFLDKLGLVFVSSYIMVLIIGVPIGLLFTPRTWCRFCPMGTMQRLSYKLGKLVRVAKKTEKKVSVSSKELCHGCGKCSRVCPMQLIPHLEFDNNNQFSSEKCIKCKTCVANCPAQILSMEATKTAIKKTKQVEESCESTRKKIKAKIKKINMLQEDVMEVIFDMGKEILPYTPGQFVLIHIYETPLSKRAYTVSGYDKDINQLRITIKKVKNGFGTEIIYSTFKEGMAVTIEGPMGDELIVDFSSEKIILLAAGIGITPFIPILEDLEKRNYEGEVTLVYGVRYERELYYRQEIENIIKGHEHMKFIPVISREKDFAGHRGYITNVLKDLDISNSKIYLCAAKSVADSTQKLLNEKNFDLNNFHVETA